MSSFKDLGIFVYNKPETEAQRRYAHALSSAISVILINYAPYLFI